MNKRISVGTPLPYPPSHKTLVGGLVKDVSCACVIYRFVVDIILQFGTWFIQELGGGGIKCLQLKRVLIISSGYRLMGE